MWSMMTSSNEKISRITGPLCGEFTSHRWIPDTKTSDAELWCFLWSAPWRNGCVNNREALALRHHRVHHDVIVLFIEKKNTVLLPCDTQKFAFISTGQSRYNTTENTPNRQITAYSSQIAKTFGLTLKIYRSEARVSRWRHQMETFSA